MIIWKVKNLQTENITINDIDELLLNADYVSNNEISTTVYLSLFLGRPMLIEGPPGVGKTELAKVIAKSFERDFFRIQCYEGITFEQIVGEWNYQKQLLHLEAARNDSNKESKIFAEEFFIRRPLLNAFLNENNSVLLIDEIDKADEEVESFLLQALGEKEITINDLGTFQLQNDLIVILTSNSQRSLLDETKDRCLFLYIPYPSVEREIEIVKSRIPEAEEEVVSTVVKLVHDIRNLNLMKKPSVRGTIDWVRSVTNLGTKNMDESLENSIGVAIKNESDKKRVIKDVLSKR
ncbi:AAA family ATPase [Methanobrevibacter sp.]|uniref:AAA family ATPase n=1 Tax=Methanobrevibacter sp. TaxID=66852 RepID=UPI0038679CF1